MPVRALITSLLLATSLHGSADTVRRGLFASPAVSRDHIVFVRGGELWKVSKHGGLATSLGVSASINSLPKFSPDGKTVALLTSFDGAYELGTVSIDGGPVFRVTHYPRNGKGLMQWLRDGRLLYFTESDFRVVESQLYTVPAKGGLPSKLPVPYGADASLSDDGESLAYTLHLRPNLYWKHYKGGMAQDIWLYNLRTGKSKQVTRWKGYDLRPMWLGKRLYYMSDQGDERAMNVWMYDPATGRRRQITRRKGHDILNPSLWQETGEMVYQWGPDIYLLDLESGRESLVNVQLPEASQVVAPHTIDAADWTSSRTISPKGDQAVIEARGDLWVAPASGGTARNLTRTNGVFEREPAWSPDGRWIACWSDATAEYQLTLIDPTSGQSHPITHFTSGFRQGIRWSPDSKQIAFTDNAGRFYVGSADGGDAKQFDSDPLGRVNPVSWSPGSRWIAYTKYGPNFQTAIWAYDTQTGTRRQVTSGMAKDAAPIFDRSGRRLIYTSVRDFSRRINQAMDRLTIYATPTVIMSLPWPNGTEAQGPQLPVASGRFAALDVTAGGLLVYLRTNPLEPSKLQAIQFEQPDGEKTLVEGVDGFELSADGRKLLVLKDGQAFVTEATETMKLGEPIVGKGLQSTIEPAREWGQIARDVWRLYRDYFYDPDMHGVEWDGLWTSIQPMLALCCSRDDVNFVLGEMISELSVGHAMMIEPGDVPSRPWQGPGTLGVDFELDRGAFRISRIYEGAAWDSLGRNPLRIADPAVKVGDYLLAVDSKPLDPSVDPWAPFIGLAGKKVKITLGPNPQIDTAARSVEVTALARESDLRQRDWVERNRQFVERASDGKLGYIYLPDESASGMAEFVRQFYGQTDKQGVVVDARWNSGGSTSDRMVEMLDRPLLNAYQERYSTVPFPIPEARIPGPKCLLINRVTSSSGENFAYYFKKAGLGQLIGTRTWGGLIGVNDNQPLIDGGFWWAPQSSFFIDRDRWMPEGIGVKPDIEVMDDPALMRGGRDPQLETAIRHLLNELARRGSEAIFAPRARRR